MLHFHVASNRTNSDGLAVHFGLTPTSTSSCTVKKEKLDLCCCITARAKPMGRQCQTARMKLMFVRWFGRPFWTHTDVHLLVYTHCSLDGSAVHFGLPPRFTHRFLVYIQRKTRLLYCCIAARAKTNGSTVSDCPNETRVHHILFQYQ
jgi:hypothetical protein